MEESERRLLQGDTTIGVGRIARRRARGSGLVRRRELQQSSSPSSDDDAPSSSLTSEQQEIIDRHDEQVDLAYVVKMGIACLFLLGLVVWFVWSFWQDKHRRRRSRARRSASSHRRQGRLVRRTSSLDSSVETMGSLRSAEGSCYQRDARAVGNQHQSVMECVNPMWVAGQQPGGAVDGIAGPSKPRSEYSSNILITMARRFSVLLYLRKYDGRCSSYFVRVENSFSQAQGATGIEPSYDASRTRQPVNSSNVLCVT